MTPTERIAALTEALNGMLQAALVSQWPSGQAAISKARATLAAVQAPAEVEPVAGDDDLIRRADALAIFEPATSMVRRRIQDDIHALPAYQPVQDAARVPEIAALIVAAQALADHDAFLDREYLSHDLIDKLDAVRVTLRAIVGGDA